MVQINKNTWFVEFNRKYLYCKHCQGQLKNRPMFSIRKNKYCVFCAVILNITSIEDLNNYGYKPPRRSFEQSIEHKKLRLSSRKEPKYAGKEKSKITITVTISKN